MALQTFSFGLNRPHAASKPADPASKCSSCLVPGAASLVPQPRHTTFPCDPGNSPWKRPGLTEGQKFLNPHGVLLVEDSPKPPGLGHTLRAWLSHCSRVFMAQAPPHSPLQHPLTSQTQPWAMTTMWWASRTVLSRWAMTRTVRPVLARSRASCTTRSDSASRALVASSRISTAGCLMRARAMARRCFWPPDRVVPRSPGKEGARAGA